MRYALLLVVSLWMTVSACTKDENSDEPGRITFFTNNLGGHGGWMNVTINGEAKQITLN